MEKEIKESDVCICGHTRNYHRKWTSFFGAITYERCGKRVEVPAEGGGAYLLPCECRRFAKEKQDD